MPSALTHPRRIGAYVMPLFAIPTIFGGQVAMAPATIDTVQVSFIGTAASNLGRNLDRRLVLHRGALKVANEKMWDGFVPNSSFARTPKATRRFHTKAIRRTRVLSVIESESELQSFFENGE
ncbi:MAG: hypothetical protein ACOH2F_15725 [Cellulomonas sp.]